MIFREGDPGDNAYVIKSGRIEILKHAEHGEVQLAVLESGAVFGEMALFDADEVRSASARALDDAVLDELSAEDFQLLLAKCPGQLLPFLNTLVDRLRGLNRRIAATERATVLLDADINNITIESMQDAFEPITVETANLPFSIGGHPNTEPPKGHNDLEIACAEPSPCQISYEHCTIEHQEDGVYVVDAGSRFCTSVNGKYVGRAKISYKAPLVPGENTVILGDHTSPYILKITCE